MPPLNGDLPDHGNPLEAETLGRKRGDSKKVQLRIISDYPEKPRWGYRRIQGELMTFGIRLAGSTIARILRDDGLGTSPMSSFLVRDRDTKYVSSFDSVFTGRGAHEVRESGQVRVPRPSLDRQGTPSGAGSSQPSP